MSTSIKPILWSRPNKDGLYFVKIRITKDRKSSYLSTDYAIPRAQWNQKRDRVRYIHPKAEKINETIEDLLFQAQEANRDLRKEQQHISSGQIKEELEDEAESYLEYAWDHYQALRAAEKFRTAKRVRSVINKLQAYVTEVLKYDDLAFDQITVKFLRRYEVVLKQRGNEVSTVHSDFRKLRAIYNRAVREELIPQDKNPFTIFQSQFVAKKKAKTKLGLSQLRALAELDLVPHSFLWHARNIFIFSFYCGGMRIGDVLELRWFNIQAGRLVYGMEKTEKDRSVLLLPQAQKILDRYKLPQNDRSAFIFPFLDPERIVGAEALVIEKEKKTASINRSLKQIAKLAGIEATVTTHIARHSSADFLRRSGVDIYSISKVLGHSKISTTEVYLESLDVDSMDGALGKLAAV